MSISNEKFNLFIDFQRKLPLASRIVAERYFNNFCEIQYQDITDNELEQAITIGCDDTLDVLRRLENEVRIEINNNYLNSSVEVFRKYFHNSILRLNEELRYFVLIEHLNRFDLKAFFNHDELKALSKMERAKYIAVATFYVKLNCCHRCYKNTHSYFLKKETGLREFEESLIAAPDLKVPSNSIINTPFHVKKVDRPFAKDLNAYEIALRHWYLVGGKIEPMPNSNTEVGIKYNRIRNADNIEKYYSNIMKQKRKGTRKELENIKITLQKYPTILAAIDNDIDKLG